MVPQQPHPHRARSPRSASSCSALTFIPQHSDARVLDQLVYKWRHSRKVIADVLVTKYLDLYDAGWKPTRDEIVRDVEMLFSGNAKAWLGVK